MQSYGVIGLRDYGVIVLRGYGFKALHFSGLIWLWGYRYIEFSDFLKCFFRLGRNTDVLESKWLRIRFQRGKIHENIMVAFFAQIFIYGPVNTLSCRYSFFFFVLFVNSLADIPVAAVETEVYPTNYA